MKKRINSAIKAERAQEQYFQRIEKMLDSLKKAFTPLNPGPHEYACTGCGKTMHLEFPSLVNVFCSLTCFQGYAERNKGGLILTK